MVKPANCCAHITWLHDWATSLEGLATPTYPEAPLLEVLAYEGLDRLNQFLADPEILRRLNDAYIDLSAAVPEAEAQARLLSYLVNACCFCNASETQETQRSERRSNLKADLTTLAKTADKLIDQIAAVAVALGPARSLTYLEARRSAGNEAGFIRNRKGYLRSQHMPKAGNIELTDYLRCLAADAREEAVLVAASIARRRQIGGSRASLNAAIDMLTTGSIEISAASPPVPNFALVVALVSTLTASKDGIDESTVRKRFSAKRSGMSRKSRA